MGDIAKALGWAFAFSALAHLFVRPLSHAVAVGVATTALMIGTVVTLERLAVAVHDSS